EGRAQNGTCACGKNWVEFMLGGKIFERTLETVGMNRNPDLGSGEPIFSFGVEGRAQNGTCACGKNWVEFMLGGKIFERTLETVGMNRNPDLGSGEPIFSFG
nr:hypothetical protein [Tanacetum cinerariifolium]